MVGSYYLGEIICKLRHPTGFIAFYCVGELISSVNDVMGQESEILKKARSLTLGLLFN